MQDDLKACRPDDIIYSVLLTCDGQWRVAFVVLVERWFVVAVGQNRCWVA